MFFFWKYLSFRKPLNGGKNWSNALFLVFEKKAFIIGVSYRQKCDMGNSQRELQTLGPQKSKFIPNEKLYPIIDFQ